MRKAFGSLLFSGDADDEVEPDPEENNSDESFDGERSRSRNFNLFLSENGNERNTIDEKEKSTGAANAEQSENPRVMFIERLMGLHFGMQPKFGLSESLVIRKTIAPSDENASNADEPANKEPEMDFLLNRPAAGGRSLSKNKEPKSEDPTPFLLKYAAAAMVSEILNRLKLNSSPHHTNPPSPFSSLT